MLFGEYRFRDIAEDDDCPLQVVLRMAVSPVGRPRQLGYRPAAFQNYHPFTGLMHAVEYGKALRLEVGCVDSFHTTSVRDQSGRVKKLIVFKTRHATGKQSTCAAETRV